MEAFARLDPARPEVAAFLCDDRALSIWEMLRRFGRATDTRALAKACAQPVGRVQAVLDRAAELGLVRRHPASRLERHVRYEATADQIVLEVDHGSPAANRLLADAFRRFAADSRRCIDESMATRTAGRGRGPAMVSIAHLTLDEGEARELVALFKPIDEFVARASEKYDRDPEGSPRRCNYHVALHVVPVTTERLPPARIVFAEKGPKADQVKATMANRPSRLLSPRELAVARRLASGSTLAEIASDLGVSPSTVRTQCERIYRKLGINRRAQVAARLLALGGA